MLLAALYFILRPSMTQFSTEGIINALGRRGWMVSTLRDPNFDRSATHTNSPARIFDEGAAVA